MFLTRCPFFRGNISFYIPEAVYKEFVLNKPGSTLFGRPDGLFLTTKSSADKVLIESAGSVAQLKKKLGIPDNLWQGEVYRVDLIESPLLHNIRLPSGFEASAGELFKWGGHTSGGVPEAVIDPITVGIMKVYKTDLK